MSNKERAKIAALTVPSTLPPLNNIHNLIGSHVGRRECHITPDRLLVYDIVAMDQKECRTDIISQFRHYFIF